MHYILIWLAIGLRCYCTPLVHFMGSGPFLAHSGPGQPDQVDLPEPIHFVLLVSVPTEYIALVSTELLNILEIHVNKLLDGSFTSLE